MQQQTFITGGTGYIGSRLIAALVARGHAVTALARPGSESRLPPGCTAVTGDALWAESWQESLNPGATLVHLVGTPHPNPRKAEQFTRVDLASVREAALAAERRGAGHFVYVSVAQPAPAMRAYVAVRAQGEALVRRTGIPATFIRPWYVLGPGHRWPLLLLPLYRLMELVPAARAGALRLGLVTLDQMVAALVQAVEDPPQGMRVVEVPAIRRAREALAANPATA